MWLGEMTELGDPQLFTFKVSRCRQATGFPFSEGVLLPSAKKISPRYDPSALLKLPEVVGLRNASLLVITTHLGMRGRDT